VKKQKGAKIKPKPENPQPKKITEKQPGKEPHSQQVGGGKKTRVQKEKISN
jgi:hypothetical protein